MCEPQEDSAGQVQPATGCTTTSLVPTAEELDDGKRISCTCGGDDATDQLCQVRRSSNRGGIGSPLTRLCTPSCCPKRASW